MSNKKQKTNKKPIANKNFIFAAAITIIVSFASLVVYNYKNKTSLKYDAKSSKEAKIEKRAQDKVSAEVNKAAKAAKEVHKNSGLLEELSSDYILGNKFAPVTIIEYASLSCPHCAAFSRESFNKINEEYIKTGKAKFIFRNFPLNQSALSAAVFAKCQADADEENSVTKYYDVIKALFKSQDSWAFDEKYLDRLESIAKLDGMSSDDFKKCMDDKGLQNKILSARMETAQELQIKSTPSFFINGEISEGYIDYKTLKTIINQQLAKAEK